MSDASAAAIRIKPDGSSEGTVTLSQEGGKDVLTFMVADRRGSARLERVK